MIRCRAIASILSGFRCERDCHAELRARRRLQRSGAALARVNLLHTSLVRENAFRHSSPLGEEASDRLGGLPRDGPFPAAIT